MGKISPRIACIRRVVSITSEQVGTYGPGTWCKQRLSAGIVRRTAIQVPCPITGETTERVAAYGVYSGGGAYGASCVAYYTDIWDAYYGLPGTLKLP